MKTMCRQCLAGQTATNELAGFRENRGKKNMRSFANTSCEIRILLLVVNSACQSSPNRKQSSVLQEEPIDFSQTLSRPF